GAQMREGFRTVLVKTKQGTAIRGVAKHEDTFSVQIVDEEQKLHLLLKKDLASVEHPYTSLMPKIRLSTDELDNLVAFLMRYDAGAIPAGLWHPAADFNVTYA